MWRRRPLSSALLSFGLLLGGLPLAAPPLAGATEEPGAGQTPGAPVVAPQQSWNSCREFIADTSEIRTARCATVSVPVDYDQPGGTQAKLAVIRVPATGQRFGALLVNPGDPGRRRSTWSPLWHPRSPTPTFSATSTWWASTREGSATRPLRCGVAPTPSSTRTGAIRWPTTVRPVSPTSNRSTGSWPRTVLTGWASASWPISVPRPSHGTWTWFAKR